MSRVLWAGPLSVGPAEVDLLAEDNGDKVALALTGTSEAVEYLTPAQARDLAALLKRAADMAEGASA